MLLVSTRILLVCTRMLLVCFSYVLGSYVLVRLVFQSRSEDGGCSTNVITAVFFMLPRVLTYHISLSGTRSPHFDVG